MVLKSKPLIPLFSDINSQVIMFIGRLTVQKKLGMIIKAVDLLRKKGHSGRNMFVITQHCFAYYRRAIFQRLLSGEAGMKARLAFGLNVPQDNVKTFISIEEIPSHEGVEPEQYVLLKNRWLTHYVLWQSGLLREVLRRDVRVVVMEGAAQFPSNWVAVVLLRLFTKKRILFWAQAITHRPRGISGFVKRLFWRFAHGFLLYGNRARRIMIEEFGMNADDLYVVYNSLDHAQQIECRKMLSLEVLAKQREALFSTSHSDPILFYIGRLNHAKKLDMLLRATAMLFSQGYPVNVLLIGEGGAVTDLRQQSINLGIAQRVCFFGRCYDEEKIARLIGCSDLCIAPSHLGLTGMHSLTYGTPVITHDDFEKQMPEFEAVVPGLTGDFFRHDDVSSLAVTIQKWLETDRDPELLRQNCFAVIDKYYNPETQVEVFRAALEGRPASERPIRKHDYYDKAMRKA